ncbi:MAG: heavy metal-binding domain-containing protein [Candidatus Moranbacteria bacterium]|nr:heavy metal-binding domain-containing protein [Candidatus Moranbacteria bacterium]
MQISTTEFIAGHEIQEVLGISRGNTVRARNVGSDIFAGLKNLVGGEVSEYTKLIAHAREEAIQRMIKDAETLGADAIVNVRFSTSMIMQGSAEILAYGTAVKLA